MHFLWGLRKHYFAGGILLALFDNRGDYEGFEYSESRCKV